MVRAAVKGEPSSRNNHNSRRRKDTAEAGVESNTNSGSGPETVFQRRVLRSRYLAVKNLISEKKEDISGVDSDKFNSIINEVECLHQLVQKPREQVADAEALLDITSTLVSSVKAHGNEGITPSDLVNSLVRDFGRQGGASSSTEDGNNSVSWNDIGLAVSHVFRRAPGCTTVLGPMNTEPKQRKAIVQRKRVRPTEKARPEEDLSVVKKRGSQATSVLRTAAGLEPRLGDSGIGASRPVPFEAGDFEGEAELRGAEPEAGAAAEQRVTAVDEVRAYLEAERRAYQAGERPEFSPAAYAPRLHFFEPVGMTAYTPAYSEYPEDRPLRDRSSHISSGWSARTADIYGHGGSASSLAFFQALPGRVRALVEAAGFEPFIQLLTVTRVDRAVLTVLAERWWDTTNTFHFKFGEMTVTPLDFAALTGLRVGGEPIPFDSGIVLDDSALRWFLGRVPRHSGGMAAYGQFVEYWDHEPIDDEEAARMARAYLLYLFGASLFPNRRSRVHLCYLSGLVDLRQAGRFDWGGAALGTLYCLLGAASRGVGSTVGGYWRVFELWAYEVLGMYPPENTCTDSTLLPRGLAWGKAFRRAKESRGDVMTFRRWLDRLTGVVVHWDRWVHAEADFLPRSREVTRSRVLLECPLGWQWYLGDRVTRQSLGLPAFVAPGPLPPLVQRTESYTRAELELYTTPDTNLEKYLRRSLDYATYVDRFLAKSLGVEEEFNKRVAGVAAWRGTSEAWSRGGRSSRGRGARAPARGRGAGARGRGERAPEAAETSAPKALPLLKWTVGVTSPTGEQGVVDVPRFTLPPMQFPAQVPREWAEQAVLLLAGMRRLVKDYVKGKTPSTRPVPAAAPPAATQVRPQRSARTRPQDISSPPAAASTQGRGARRVPRPAAGARRYEVLPRAASRRRSAPEESEEETEEETEESSEAHAPEATDSETSSGPSGGNAGSDDESSEPEIQLQKRTRRG